MEVLAKGGSAKEKASRAASAAGRAGGRGGIVAGVAVEARVPTPQMGRFFFCAWSGEGFVQVWRFLSCFALMLSTCAILLPSVVLM